MALKTRPPQSALGSEAQTFIRQLSATGSRLAGGVVPYRLLDEASWATQGCAPLLRSAITFSARRALAAGIRRSTCSAARRPLTLSAAVTISPPPTRRAASTARLTRLLLSSDLLTGAERVARGGASCELACCLLAQPAHGHAVVAGWEAFAY